LIHFYLLLLIHSRFWITVPWRTRRCSNRW